MLIKGIFSGFHGCPLLTGLIVYFQEMHQNGTALIP